MIIMITRIMIKTIKWGTSFNCLFQMEMDIIRYMVMSIIYFGRGGSRPKLKGGGNLERGRQKHSERLARRRRAKIFGALFEKILWFFY